MSHIQKRYTRKTGAELIRERFGIPFTQSRFDKDAMKTEWRPRKAPKPDAVYGKVELYTEDQLLAYGRDLIQEIEPDQLECSSTPRVAKASEATGPAYKKQGKGRAIYTPLDLHDCAEKVLSEETASSVQHKTRAPACKVPMGEDG